MSMNRVIDRHCTINDPFVGLRAYEYASFADLLLLRLFDTLRYNTMLDGMAVGADVTP